MTLNNADTPLLAKLIGNEEVIYTRKDLEVYAMIELRALCRLYRITYRNYSKKKLIDMLLEYQEKNGSLVSFVHVDAKPKGMPPALETPEELKNLFDAYVLEQGYMDVEHYDRDGFLTHRTKKRQFISVNGFGVYLTSKGIVRHGAKYLHTLPDAFKDTWQDCRDVIQRHWEQGVASGEFNASFGIFYGKNMFGFSDKLETSNTNTNISVAHELNDEEVAKLEAIIHG